ncbi:MAG: hypothetical protein NZ571_15625, partial [Anaerolineae bacterium]|nr:hypothetical protein [Anaerolineae bacterium]
MGRSILASLALTAIFILLLVSLAATIPAKAYGVMTSGCTITLMSGPSDSPYRYKIGPFEDFWPYT